MGHGKAIQITEDTLTKITMEWGENEPNFWSYLLTKTKDQDDVWYYIVWRDGEETSIDVEFFDVFWNKYDSLAYGVDTLDFFEIEKLA